MTTQRLVSALLALALAFGLLGCPADEKQPATQGATAPTASGVPAAGSAPAPGKGQGW